MFIIEEDQSEQWSLSSCFPEALDIKFSAYRCAKKYSDFFFSKSGVPICRKFQAESFWKMVRVTPHSVRRCPKDRGDGLLLGENLFSKRFFPILIYSHSDASAVLTVDE